MQRTLITGPLPKNWVPQSDPMTGRVFYLNLKNGELHREHPVLKPILPQLKGDKAAAEARFERDVAAGTLLALYTDSSPIQSGPVQSGPVHSTPLQYIRPLAEVAQTAVERKA